MHKKVTALMMGGAVLGGLAVPATSAFASVAVSGDSQVVTGQQDAEVEFKGQIGEIDPGVTDPEDPTSPGPGTDWIKVKLPTKVLYSSTSESKHTEIISGDYGVENLSAYPVDIQVTGFTSENGSDPDIKNIGSLALKSGSTNIDLVKDSTATKPSASMFKLGVNKDVIEKPQDETGLPATNAFNFVGTTSASADLSTRTTLDNKLDITLVGLDKEGNVPAPKA